jgi:excinuclease UvrABC ATPase subunit
LCAGADKPLWRMTELRGAREHNLKNVDLELPRDS